MSDDDTQNGDDGGAEIEAPAATSGGGFMGQIDDYFGISS